MPRASSSRSIKHVRTQEPEENGLRELDEETSAVQLVSFLTGYDTRHGDDEEGIDGSDEDGRGEDGSEDDFDEDVDDDDDETEATPTKRAKVGLVGPSGSGRGTPRSTPTKPRKTPTPRKPKISITAQEEGPAGFIRPSKSDAYFLSTSRSSRTSGNSYSALVNPLSQAQYEKYTSSARSLGKCKDVIHALQERLTERFDQWELEMEEGFNLLFYGYGSKRRILNRFMTDRLASRGHCVVVNGLFPRLGIRDLLNQIEDTLSISQDIPTPPTATTPLERSTHRIYSHFLPSDAIPTDRQRDYNLASAPLYLVIHNIDSPTLRTPRSLAILSLLACSPNIHLIASFDHVHTPLLFSSSLTDTPPHDYTAGSWTGEPPTSRGFNWIYHNATTFDDYDLELSYKRLSASLTNLGGITSSSTGGISEEGALQILRSVPPMALRLLKLLLTKQLSALPPDPKTHTAHPSSLTAPVFALDNDILQRLSREKFIAREDERYNALMGEFKDHGLVVEVPTDAEGRMGRWIWVPLGKAAVERVLETMQEVEV